MKILNFFKRKTNKAVDKFEVNECDLITRLDRINLNEDNTHFRLIEQYTGAEITPYRSKPLYYNLAALQTCYFRESRDQFKQLLWLKSIKVLCTNKDESLSLYTTDYEGFRDPNHKMLGLSSANLSDKFKFVKDKLPVEYLPAEVAKALNSTVEAAHYCCLADLTLQEIEKLEKVNVKTFIRYLEKNHLELIKKANVDSSQFLDLISSAKLRYGVSCED